MAGIKRNIIKAGKKVFPTFIPLVDSWIIIGRRLKIIKVNRLIKDMEPKI